MTEAEVEELINEFLDVESKVIVILNFSEMLSFLFSHLILRQQRPKNHWRRNHLHKWKVRLKQNCLRRCREKR